MACMPVKGRTELGARSPSALSPPLGVCMPSRFTRVLFGLETRSVRGYFAVSRMPANDTPVPVVRSASVVSRPRGRSFR